MASRRRDRGSAYLLGEVINQAYVDKNVPASPSCRWSPS
jgi:hypothetical protein